MSFALDVAPDLTDALLETLGERLDWAREVGGFDALSNDPTEAFEHLMSISDPEPGSPVFVAQHALLMAAGLRLSGQLAIVDGFPGVRDFLAAVLADSAVEALDRGHYATARGVTDLLVRLVSERAEAALDEDTPTVEA